MLSHGVWTVRRRESEMGVASDSVSLPAAASSSSSSSSSSSTSSSVDARGGAALASSLAAGADGMPRLVVRTRIVRLVKGADGEVYLHCSCLFFTSMLMCCRHAICVKRLMLSILLDWHFRWTRRFRDAVTFTPRTFDDGRHGASAVGIPTDELLAYDAIPLASTVNFERDHLYDSVNFTCGASASSVMAANARIADAPDDTVDAAHRYGVAKSRLGPLFDVMLRDLQLLSGTSFNSTLSECEATLQEVHRDLLSVHGNGQSINTNVMTGGSGRDKVRHH